MVSNWLVLIGKCFICAATKPTYLSKIYKNQYHFQKKKIHNLDERTIHTMDLNSHSINKRNEMKRRDEKHKKIIII